MSIKPLGKDKIETLYMISMVAPLLVILLSIICLVVPEEVQGYILIIQRVIIIIQFSILFYVFLFDDK
nr:MAG TPA: hypothetical protein [Caudoviricetes sp.]